MRWALHAERSEIMRNAYKRLVGNPEGSRPRRTHGRKWKCIKMYLYENGPGLEFKEQK